MNRLTACFEQKKSSPYASDTKYEELLSIVRNAKLNSYKELEIATKNFNPKNKIGEGSFGSVYKGRLKDDTLAAIKVIKSQNEHEVHEILNKIETFSELEHENLVKMYGCCLKGHHRVFVRDYLENDSIAQTLLGGDSSKVQFSWKIRSQICIGVAQGLAFLHEEVEPPIVHGEVKASNIFLDRDFTPKISDFGLAKLFPPQIGDCVSVKARSLCEKGKLIELVDKALEADFNDDEACRYLMVGLLCTQDPPNRRPAMSIVAKTLKGEIDVEEGKVSEPHYPHQGGKFGN